MKKIILTEEQLQSLTELMVNKKEDKFDTNMTKQQLFTIAILAHKMWEKMENDEELEDWMVSKIAQTEQSIINVVKAYMYGEVEEKLKGMDTLNYDDLVIGN